MGAGIPRCLRRWGVSRFNAAGGVAALQVLEHATSALRHQRRFGVGRAHQRGGYSGFARVQPVWRFAKQRLAECVNADDFAPKRHQVQVGLQNLVFAQALFQPFGRHRLLYFL